MYIAIGANVIINSHYALPGRGRRGVLLEAAEGRGRRGDLPTIDAKQAQATMESDRVRTFREIADSIGMAEFNR
jgi:hypothetical protein